MFEVLTDLLKSGDYWIFWVIISILFLINLPKIIDVYDSTRKRRVIHLQDAISDQNVSDRLKQHFKDEVEIEHFRIAHGFAVSKVLLDAILTIKDRVSGKVSFGHVLRVAKQGPDITGIESENYRIKLSKIEQFMFGFNLLGGIILYLLGVFLIWYSLGRGIEKFDLSSMLLGLLYFPLSIYMFKNGISLVSAWHINSALDEYSNAFKSQAAE